MNPTREYKIGAAFSVVVLCYIFSLTACKSGKEFGLRLLHWFRSGLMGDFGYSHPKTKNAKQLCGLV